jgi:hypothetical protein
MSQQPELTSHPMPANPAPLSGSAPGAALGSSPEFVVAPPQPLRPAPPRIPRWLERSELFLRVLLQMYIGLAICYAPWSGQFLTFLPWSRMLWDQNPLFAQFPALGVLAANGAVRGLVSGLGLLNLWIAFRDAIRHRDN